jgi:hypothetical protein
MKESVDVRKLKASWTKYDIVKLVDIDSIEELKSFIAGSKPIDAPVLRAFIGVNNLSDDLPSFWDAISSHPKYLRLFALIAAITTHHSILEKMAQLPIKAYVRTIHL